MDTYRTGLLKKNDVVLDLGAGIGDFSILASKKIGPSGKVIAIEPDPDDFRLLEKNIKTNNCLNVVPLNCGVGKESAQSISSFRGRRYTFDVHPLDTLLENIGFTSSIDFVKMDIEGFETDVIGQSIRILKNARIISIELHDTKKNIDAILLNNGFIFVPLSKLHIYKQIIKNLVLHPIVLTESYLAMRKYRPHMFSRALNGFGLTSNGQYLNGIYVKSKD